MTIDEAIKTLEIENKHPWNHSNSDLRNAVKLGIEALRRFRVLRLISTNEDAHWLPGETKD